MRAAMPVTYATRVGSREEIARAVAEVLSESGLQPVL